MKKLIFGYGYLGSRVASRWFAQGDEVIVVTRSAEKAQSLTRAGYHPIIADLGGDAALPQLPAADTVLYAVGYDGAAGADIETLYAGGLQKVLRAVPNPPRVIYISTTGVYAQDDGGWVDEDSECLPARGGGRASLEAERVLGQHPLGTHGVVLRMAGIYGPGRIPLAQLLREGKPIPAAVDGYLNLIHVEDAANIVLLAEQLPTEQNQLRCFCVSDGQPVVRRDYYTYLAQLLQAPPPTFAPPDSESPSAARARGNKRISNRRLVAQLRPILRYPTYREGLTEIVKQLPGD